MRDPDIIEVLATIAALKSALDRASALIREQDPVHATLNAPLATANERADQLQTSLLPLPSAQSIWGRADAVLGHPQNRAAAVP